MLFGRGLTRLAQLPLGCEPAHTAICQHGVSRPAPTQLETRFGYELEALIHKTMDRYHVPGLAIAIVRGNETSARVSYSFLPTGSLHR